MARCFGWGNPKTLPTNGLDGLFTPASQTFHATGDESDTISPASPSMGDHHSLLPHSQSISWSGGVCLLLHGRYDVYVQGCRLTPLPVRKVLYTRVERCARIRSISRYFGGIPHHSRVVFSRVFAFSRPNTVRTRVISPIDGRETARKRSDNINTFYMLFAPAREFIA